MIDYEELRSGIGYYLIERFKYQIYLSKKEKLDIQAVDFMFLIGSKFSTRF